MTVEKQPFAAGGPVRYVVARADAVAVGERLIVEVGGRKIGIFNIDGEFHAILYQCPHAAGPLCLGPLVELVYADRPGEIRSEPDVRFLQCPWHGWLFDLRSGQSWWDPARTRARLFPLEVQRGDAIAKAIASESDDTAQPTEQMPGPYVVEKFPLTVEDEYLVVTMRPRPARSFTDASL